MRLGKKVPYPMPSRMAGKGLSWSLSNCIRYLDCRSCQDACPANCLHFHGQDIEIGDACLGCGRCAAACPTHALQLAGFAAAAERTLARTAYVDCRKVSPEASPEGAVRVACLGGISTSWILGMQEKNPGTEIVLLDRGWCRDCSAGQGEQYPAQAALQETQALLGEAGLAPPQLPRIEFRPLPPTGRPLEIPNAVTEERLPRRGFFTRAVHKAAHAFGEASAGISASQPCRGSNVVPFGHGRIIPAERLKRARALATIAHLHHRPISPRCVPQIEISWQCRNHRVCASVCPTRALQKYEADDQNGVRFDSVLCVDCRRCEQSCPEGALRFHQFGRRPFMIGHSPLTAHAVKVCIQCEEEFSGTDGDRCPACSKNDELLRSGHLM